MPKPIKISRQAIKQTLKETPIDQILVGVHNADKVNLTKKQKEFARKVAEGKPKAQAYRETYNTQASKQSQAEQASRLSANPKIASMIEAFTLANEAREYLIPAQIRTMAIQNLVGIAIAEGEKTSNKLKALELIGKMSEVALFTERKEHIHTTNADEIKAKLIEGLRLAFNNSRQVNDLAKRKAESLLVELSDARPAIDQYETPAPLMNPDPADPLHPDPQKSTDVESEGLHSNLHNQSLPIANQPSSDANELLDDLTITAVIVTNPLESDTCASIGSFTSMESQGEGVINSGQPAPKESMETPPVNNPKQNG